MFWIIGPVIVVVLLFLAGFRKSAVGLLIATLIASALIYWNINVVERQETSRMSVSDIALENVAVRRTFDSTYELTGRITNKSDDYRVDAISFIVTIRDCTAPQKMNCVTTGQKAVNVSVSVPPQQTRDFTGTLYFGKGHRPPKGTLAWDYKVTSITAQRQ